MKLRNLFYALLALPMVFAACEGAPVDEPTGPQNPGGDEPTEIDAVLTLTSSATMEFGAEGGNGEISYTLENPAEGVTIDVACDSIWVLVNDPAETITFSVEKNEGEAREAKITVSYATKSFEVTVKQAAKGENPAPVVPALTLTSEDTMTFDCKLQEGVIAYTLENPIQGQEVKAKSNVDWISSFIVREAEISFVVAANGGDAREGKITVEYGILNFEVTVKQSEYVAPTPVIKLSATTMEFEAEGGDCFVTYSVENPVEGVELVIEENAEWLTDTVAENGEFYCYVTPNDGDMVREAVVTFTYGEIVKELKIKQYQDGYDPSMEYSVFEIIDTWAECENGAKQWDLFFVEKDDSLGEMQTRISFALAEANPSHPTEGHYSVADGSILVNSTYQNGFSTYRSNGSLATDITVAEFDIAVDTDNKTISVSGYFQAANNIVSLEYNGEMRGMDLSGGQGNTHFTEWKWVRKNWEEAGQSLFTARSTDGALEICFDIRHSGGSKLIPAATYEVMAHGVASDYVANSSYLTLNSVKSSFAAGTVIVEHIRGGYIFTFDITDDLGRPLSGVIQGAIEGGTNP